MRGSNGLVVTLVALATIAAAHADAAATFTLNFNDPAGTGFFDPTAAAPVGGNPGTTVGAQRQNAFNFVAGLWGARLTSSIPIVVGATFGALTPCTPTGGVLGSAGPSNGLVFPGVMGSVPANTIVTVAEGEKLQNANSNGTTADINAQFNGNIGTAGCLTSLNWYYGFDSAPPAGKLDFVTVLLHEMGHGLGMLTFVNTATGAEASGFDDIYEVFLRDNVTAPNTWTTMSDAQRLASAINTNNLVWSGPLVTAATATSGADGSGRKMLYAPNPRQAGSSVSHWSQSTAGGASCAACTDLVPFDLMKPFLVGPVHTTFITHLALMDMGWGPVSSPVELLSFEVQ